MNICRMAGISNHHHTPPATETQPEWKLGHCVFTAPPDFECDHAGAARLHCEDLAAERPSVRQPPGLAVLEGKCELL